jgi:hypothetical protein
MTASKMQRKNRGNQREKKRSRREGKSKYTLQALDCASIPDDEKNSNPMPIRIQKQNSRVILSTRDIIHVPFFQNAESPFPMSLKVKLHVVALKHHASLALQERTRHLSHLSGLDKTVPLGGALRRLAELDKSAALEGVALRELHHVACATCGGERSAVGREARGFGSLAGGCEFFLGSGCSALLR